MTTVQVTASLAPRRHTGLFLTEQTMHAHIHHVVRAQPIAAYFND